MEAESTMSNCLQQRRRRSDTKVEGNNQEETNTDLRASGTDKLGSYIEDNQI